MATIRNITAPNLPSAPIAYEQRYQEQLTNTLRLFFNSVTNSANSPKPYGSFYDTTNQTAAVINTAYPVQCNMTTDAFHVTLDLGTSRYYLTESGVYNIQFSAQLGKTTSSAGKVYFWLRVNGNDIPHSASVVGVKDAAGIFVPAWNFVQPLRSGDYFQLMWSTDDTDITLDAVAASSPVPEIPSVILTVTWVSAIAL
jgi:hypothetical protein